MQFQLSDTLTPHKHDAHHDCQVLTVDVRTRHDSPYLVLGTVDAIVVPETIRRSGMLAALLKQQLFASANPRCERRKARLKDFGRMFAAETSRRRTSP